MLHYRSQTRLQVSARQLTRTKIQSWRTLTFNAVVTFESRCVVIMANLNMQKLQTSIVPRLGAYYRNYTGMNKTYRLAMGLRAPLHCLTLSSTRSCSILLAFSSLSWNIAGNLSIGTPIYGSIASISIVSGALRSMKLS